MRREPAHVLTADVTFTLNKKTYNDKRYTYLCPWENVQEGDIVMVDTCNGPALARVEAINQWPYQGIINKNHKTLLGIFDKLARENSAKCDMSLVMTKAEAEYQAQHLKKKLLSEELSELHEAVKDITREINRLKKEIWR